MIRVVPEIEAAALVSVDGLMIASVLPSEISEDRIAAMSAAILSVAEHITRELKRGKFEMSIIRGEHGYIVVTDAGPDAVLVAIAGKEAKLGLIFHVVRSTAKSVAGLLGR